jgi:hypothetical protein
MKNVVEVDFNIKTEVESDIQQKGYVPLIAEEIQLLIAGKTFLGSFPPSFKYVISVNRDGSLEGKNNYQHYDVGKWTINTERNTLSVNWNFGWANTTNHVYLVDDVVQMFDVTSGKLNTSFDEPIESVESIKTFEI